MIATCLFFLAGLVDRQARFAREKHQPFFGPNKLRHFALYSALYLGGIALGTSWTLFGTGVLHDPFAPPSATPGVGVTAVTAICIDGTYSFSQHAEGTCSYHGGVRVWVNHPPT